MWNIFFDCFFSVILSSRWPGSGRVGRRAVAPTTKKHGPTILDINSLWTHLHKYRYAPWYTISGQYLLSGSVCTSKKRKKEKREKKRRGEGKGKERKKKKNESKKRNETKRKKSMLSSRLSWKVRGTTRSGSISCASPPPTSPPLTTSRRSHRGSTGQGSSSATGRSDQKQRVFWVLGLFW